MTVATKQSMMQRAIDLAKQGHGCVEPNPMVGCVIVNPKGHIVGEGFHAQFGQAHAEVNALALAGSRANGATAFVTLEPCNHFGETPPCTQALIDEGISKVVIGTIDPHELSTGGAQSLRDSGIQVEVLEDEDCKRLIGPFAWRIETGLPWVTCKWAQTVDGCIETPEGESNWISSADSQALVHQERRCVDAIIVGVGTVIADNPLLTVRNVEKRRTPLRIVIDPNLRTPLDAHILNDDASTLIAHSEDLDASSFPCESITLPSENGVLILTPLLKHLVDKHNATNVIVEGGATTFRHFFEQQLVNELWVITSPATSKVDSFVNMNDVVLSLDCTLESEAQCGVDTLKGYLMND